MSEGRSSTIEVRAHAKLNAFLRVLGRREDGYHELETLILPLTLGDRIRVTVDGDPSRPRAEYGIDEMGGPPMIVNEVPTDDTNLLIRAASTYASRVDPTRSVRMSLFKNIPVGAGMGGGSADAAAVLRALNGLFAAGLSDEALGDIAASIGSDVPALLAAAPVIARGRGERVERVRAAGYHWMLVRFPLGVRTPDAFGWWDEDGGGTGPEPDDVIRAVAGGDPSELGPLLFNDLEAPVFRRRPDVAEAKRMLLEAGLAGAVMCGSGSAVAGLVQPGVRPEDLSALSEDLERLTGLSTTTTESLAG